MGTTNIPASFRSKASIRRRFILWLTLCVVCSIPSYVLASTAEFLPIALSLSVILFSVLMTWVTSTQTFYFLSRIRYMRKCMYIGYGIRVCLSIIFPAGVFVDLFTGVVTIIALEPLSEIMPREGFLIAFIGTFIQGTMMNCVVTLLILIIWVVPWWNAKYRTENDNILCHECLYDLKRIPEGEPCPKCGAKNNEQSANNTSCLNCGYDLKATPEGSPCPECGSKEGVGDLFDSTPLSRTPGWVFHLWSAGILLITVSILCMNVLSIIWGLVWLRSSLCS